MGVVQIPQCAVAGCENSADPRWYAHAQRTGRAVMICDGHDSTPCKATTLADCTCPVVFDDGSDVEERTATGEIRERPRKPDAKRVDAGDYVRASGDTICERCGFAYYDHDDVRGFRWLHRLCDGRLVKL